MSKKLQNYLEYYKEYTIEMTLNLEKDDIDNFEVFLEKRGQIIEEIKQLNFDRNEFKKICEELDIINMDNQLNRIINDKRNDLKNQILKLKKSQSANNAYHSNLSINNLFSKKV